MFYFIIFYLFTIFFIFPLSLETIHHLLPYGKKKYEVKLNEFSFMLRFVLLFRFIFYILLFIQVFIKLWTSHYYSPLLHQGCWEMKCCSTSHFPELCLASVTFQCIILWGKSLIIFCNSLCQHFWFFKEIWLTPSLLHMDAMFLFQTFIDYRDADSFPHSHVLQTQTYKVSLLQIVTYL